MAARAISESSDSSEQNSSDESDFYDVNLYDSDVAETSEPSEDTGPRPYRYEPRRVQQQQSREDETESETDRLGNTETRMNSSHYERGPYFFLLQFRCECGMCQPMPSVSENVCCHEIGQIWLMSLFRL